MYSDHKSSRVPTKFNTAAYASKVMPTQFWDVNGLVQSKPVLPGTPINSERYCETRGKQKVWLRRVRPHIQQLLLQHECWTALKREKNCLCFTVLDHPPLCHDLQPSHFHFFPSSRNILEDISTRQTTKFFGRRNAQFCHDEFMKLSEGW